MLTDEEKREMLEDAQSIERRNAFRACKRNLGKISFEEYINFLSAIQQVFKPFEISTRKTKTELNKL